MGSSAYTIEPPQKDSGYTIEPPAKKVAAKEEPYAIKPMVIGPLAGGVRQSTMKTATSALPYVGATAGALMGEGVASIPGAAIGGAAGESLRQLTNRFFGIADKKTETSMGASEEIGKAGVTQGAIQAATFGAGKVLKPIAGALKSSAGESLSKVLSPTTKTNKILTQKMLPRMIEDVPIAMSRKGLLSSVGNSLKGATEVLDKALDAVPAGTNLAPGQMSAVTGALDALADSLKSPTAAGGKAVVPGAEGSVKFIEGMKDFVQKTNPSFDAMRDLRKILDGLVDKSGKWNMTGAEGSEREIQRFTANRIREELARAAPDVAAANKDYSFYKGMQTVLEDTMERTTGQQGNLTRRILMAGGAAKGGITGVVVMKALAQLVDSTAWRTVSAASKSKIANLIAKDQLGEASALIIRLGQAANAAHSSTSPLPELQTGDNP